MEVTICCQQVLDGTDQALMRAYLGGEERAFEVLVQRYQNRLVHYLNGLVRDYHQAVDLAQETFIRVFRNAGRYQGKYPFSTWIYRIATNLAIDELRRRKGKGRFFLKNVLDLARPDLEDYPLADTARSPVEDLECQERLQVLRRALDSLPEKYRFPFLLREVEELSYRETARVLAIRIGTVKSRIHRAKMLLREKLWEWTEGRITRDRPRP